MRVSEHYGLGLTQPSLEFLDVDVTFDTKLFVDPHAFHYIQTDWGRECVSLLQDFYDEVLDAIRAGDRPRGLLALSNAGESNEVHLGLSSGESRGSGIGLYLAEDIYDALTASSAVTSGLTTDVEDTVLFVEGVGHDRVSDMTINVVRRQLIEFTQRVCNDYGIPLIPDVDSGPMWNRMTHAWEHTYVELPMVDNKRLLLIPKTVARKTATFDPGDYLTYFVLPYLVGRELATPGSRLIKRRALKGKYRGERYVTKKSIRERNSRSTNPKSTKVWNTDVTNEKPDLLGEYRDSREGLSEPPPHDVIAAQTSTPEPDWDALLAAVLAVPPGQDGASDYHRAVQNLLTALFYPALTMPEREFDIHDRRKRIDITYANVASSGFFHWLDKHGGVEAGMIVVECKNYTGALANPEFDQITGRFSPRRGRFGLLLYRGYGAEKRSVVTHFKDAALDDRGWVIALDDDDLTELVDARRHGDDTTFAYLMTRFRELI
jgi:hypothetical protein